MATKGDKVLPCDWQSAIGSGWDPISQVALWDAGVVVLIIFLVYCVGLHITSLPDRWPVYTVDSSQVPILIDLQ